MFTKLKTEVKDYQDHLKAITKAGQDLGNHAQTLTNELANLTQVIAEINHDLELFNFRNQAHLDRINHILEKYHQS
ncbi:hypothetical protein [Limosilactobacillus gastricus]|uniref:hypothetical protein n=1 Tax=Limosilactobacillus gastricus TaxID=227942 RepID=UPI0002E32A60|nr:hypothetical protein [Limosilactobacillus gastricus]